MGSNSKGSVRNSSKNFGGDVVGFIPLSGTEVDKPITGDLKYGILDGETRKITFKSPDEFDFDLRFGDDGGQLGATPVLIGFYATDGTSYGKFGLDSVFNPVIEIGNGTNFGYLQFVGNQILRFHSDHPLCSGIDGFVDYSANYTDTCFVQKIYVDSNFVAKGVDNSTTVVLSSATLNSTYPDATTGFRVYCASIIVGAMTYEKTPTGWLGFTCVVP